MALVRDGEKYRRTESLYESASSLGLSCACEQHAALVHTQSAFSPQPIINVRAGENVKGRARETESEAQ